MRAGRAPGRPDLRDGLALRHQDTRQVQERRRQSVVLVAAIMVPPEKNMSGRTRVPARPYRSRMPDLAGWRRERMPELPDTAYFTLAPDWVCEVLSASTRKVDLHEKRPIYAGAGVAHLWLIDPVDHTLEAFELLDGQWLLIASAKDDAPVCIRPLDAVTFKRGHPCDAEPVRPGAHPQGLSTTGQSGTGHDLPPRTPIQRCTCHRHRLAQYGHPRSEGEAPVARRHDVLAPAVMDQPRRGVG